MAAKERQPAAVERTVMPPEAAAPSATVETGKAVTAPAGGKTLIGTAAPPFPLDGPAAGSGTRTLGWLGTWLSTPRAGPALTLATIVLLLSATAVLARHRRAVRPVRAAGSPTPIDPPALTALEARSATTPSEPEPDVRPPPGQPATSDFAAAQDLKATAEALSNIVHQIIEELLPQGPLRDVLRADLTAIDQRLTSPELAAALDEERLDVARGMFEQIVADLQRIRTLARIEHERSTGLVVASNAIPASREAAFAFLGVNAGASERIVKKVVDALRQTWHPDLAQDEPDRVMRETRMKQINGAWDVIRASARVVDRARDQ